MQVPIDLGLMRLSSCFCAFHLHQGSLPASTVPISFSHQENDANLPKMTTREPVHSQKRHSMDRAGPWGRNALVSAQVYQQFSSQTQREELILGNLSLVRHILGRMTAKLPPRIDLDNLEAAGMLGLVEAANRFEPDRGVSFKTFAYTRIRGAIYDELRRNSPFPQDLL